MKRDGSLGIALVAIVVGAAVTTPASGTVFVTIKCPALTGHAAQQTVTVLGKLVPVGTTVTFSTQYASLNPTSAAINGGKFICKYPTSGPSILLGTAPSFAHNCVGGDMTLGAYDCNRDAATECGVPFPSPTAVDTLDSPGWTTGHVSLGKAFCMSQSGTDLRCNTGLLQTIAEQPIATKLTGCTVGADGISFQCTPM
jgi:hypothetical protein